MLLEESIRPLIVSAGAVILCFVLLQGDIPDGDLKRWFGFAIAITLIRATLAVFDRQDFMRVRFSIRQRTALYCVSLVLAGAGWGALMFLWNPAQSVAVQLTLVLFPTALAAGAVSSYGVWRPAYLGFMLSCLLPIVGVFLFSGKPEYTGLATPSILYITGLWLLASRSLRGRTSATANAPDCT